MPQQSSLIPAQLVWDDAGVPESTEYQDVYFSRDNGLEETRYVFLGHNGLPQRWEDTSRSCFTIGETGFGTGLNFLAAWHAFLAFRQRDPAHPLRRLHFVSFEKFPLTRHDLAKALAVWPELQTQAQSLLAQYPEAVAGCHRLLFDDGTISLDLWLMDVHDAVDQMPNHQRGWIDAWFLDGFAPSKNPQMWTQHLFDAMSRHSRDGCTVSTFTAAGFVRRGLISAGFAMGKVPGFGGKREMIRGQLEHRKTENAQPAWFSRDHEPEPDPVTIIGGGLAGISTAWALARRGIDSRLVFSESDIAQGASGNRQGALYPFLNADHSPHSQFYQHGFGFTRRLVNRLQQQGHSIRHDWCGLLQLALDDKRLQRYSKIQQRGWPTEFLRWLTPEQASTAAGITLPYPALYFPGGGWLRPSDLCRALLAEARTVANVDLMPGQQVTQLEKTTSGWQLQLASGQALQSNCVVLAAGWRAGEFKQLAGLPLAAIRGQISHLPADQDSGQLRSVLCYDGYLTPADGGRHCIGASFIKQWPDLAPNPAEDETNLEMLHQALPQWPAFSAVDRKKLDSRVGVRGISRDHMPLVGAAPDLDGHVSAYADLWRGDPKTSYPRPPRQGGLYLNAGHGARGICSAPLCGELLAAEITQELLPLPSDLQQALSPNRRWIRNLKRRQPITD